MKRRMTIALLAILTLVLAACGPWKQGDIVEVTVPAQFKGPNQSFDEFAAGATQSGFKDVRENEDGTITFLIDEGELEGLQYQVLMSVEQIADASQYDTIESITYDEGMKEFTLTVDPTFLMGEDLLIADLLGMNGMLYQATEGVSVDEMNVDLIVKLIGEEEVAMELSYPVDTDEAEEPKNENEASTEKEEWR